MHRHLFISVLRLFSLLGTALAQSYVEPPAVLGQIPTPIVPYTFRPTKVYSTSGTVANAGGLVKPSGPSGRNGSFSSAKLSPNSSIVLDFSLNVGGYPVFEFAPGTSNESPTIQYTVSESLAALELGVGDGYLYLGNPGARYRSEVIPVSGRGERRLGTGIQGAQRFMLIEHIDGTADVSINEVGFQAVTDVTSISDLPGSFNSSDEYLNELWVAGARTVQLGCTGKGSLTPIWHVSAIGTLIESKNIAIHQRSQNWGLVDFSLSLYIISGSIFTVNKGDQYAPYPGATVFYLKAGNNGSGTFSRYSGSSVDLPSGSLSTGRWHNVKFSVRGDSNTTMTASIDGVEVGTGLFGFSAGNDTAIIVKDLVVQDLDGNALYSNNLTSQSAMGDFATGTNSYSVCFDGAKRDRVVWAGDFSIFGPTVFYSTANVEAVSGSLLLLLTGVQDNQGQISSAILPSTMPSEVPTSDWRSRNFYSLIYAISSANAWYEWHQYTGDTRLIRKCLSFLDKETGLITVLGLAALDFDGYDGPTSGTHIGANAILVWALRNAAIMSDSLGDSVASGYREAANNIEKAVNERLFSNSTGAYMLVDGNTTVGISQDGNSYAILSGIASASGAPSSARAVVEAMRSLNTSFGPLSFSNTTRFLPIVSPCASGFHTWAAFEAGMGEEAISLMHTVWMNQTDVDNPWYTGMSWEFINGTTGELYNPKYSSQAHGWGSAPTWQLSRYMLGVSPTTPRYSTWSFPPRTVNLTFANGRVPTPWGTIVAAWEDTGLRFDMRIATPSGANGTIVIPGAANKKVIINEVEVSAGRHPTPSEVIWAGADGSAYKLNVTSSGVSFVLSAS
ncbi:Six-hairpin glycosidase-like protein [Rhizoctonia solani]|nr:Six-hairpin glycosidase-like protein [Rhizoctonia solani]